MLVEQPKRGYWKEKNSVENFIWTRNIEGTAKSFELLNSIAVVDVTVFI